MLVVPCRWWSRYPPADSGCALKESGAPGKPTPEQAPDRAWNLWRGAGQDFLSGPVTAVPKGLNPVEGTHNVAFLEEMPVWMTYTGVVCEEPYPVGGTSHGSRGAAWRERSGKVLLMECNPHFLSPCPAWGGGCRRGRSEFTLGGREGHGVGGRLGFFFCFVLIPHYSTQLFISNKLNYFPQVKTVLLMYTISLFLSWPMNSLLCFLFLVDGRGLLERLQGIWWPAKVTHHELLDIPKKDFL